MYDPDRYVIDYINGLVQERRYSIANVLEFCLSCIKPLICVCAIDRLIFYEGPVATSAD